MVLYTHGRYMYHIFYLCQTIIDVVGIVVTDFLLDDCFPYLFHVDHPGILYFL